MYTYRQILKQALKITWGNRRFWFFGYFLALLGAGNELEIFFGSYGFGGQGIFLAIVQGIGASDLFTPAGIQGLTKTIFLHPIYIFVLALVFLLIFAVSLLIVWLTIISQSAIIANSIAASKNRPLSFADGFGLGIKNFWPVFGVNIISKTVIIGLIALVGIAALTDIVGQIGFVIVFDLFILLVIAFSFLTRLWVCDIVLKENSFKKSFLNSLSLIKKYWLIMVELTLILFFLTVLVNGFLSFLISSAIYYSMKTFFWAKPIMLLIFVLSIISFVFIQLLVIILQWSAWAIIFELMTGKKAALISKLDTLFSRK